MSSLGLAGTADSADPVVQTVTIKDMVPHIAFLPDDADGESWENFPAVPVKGMVGCFMFDRADDWNVFVVVDFDEELKRVHAIFPRLRFAANGDLEWDQDRITEVYESSVACVCPPKGASACNCGAVDTNNAHYATTFKPIYDDEHSYVVDTFNHDEIAFPYIDYKFLRKRDLFDQPFCTGFCYNH